MEHGTISDPSSSTFSITDEDHTLANSVRFTLNKDPRVVFCGYSIPHPSENRVNVRVQTTGKLLRRHLYSERENYERLGEASDCLMNWPGDPAKDVLKDSLQDLMNMCRHVRGTFDKAVEDFKMSQPMKR